jgi:hypothetical protein
MDSFETPILVTAFNRPDLLEAMLKRLSAAKATNVYISIDGANWLNHEESYKVLDCQKLAMEFNKSVPNRNQFSDLNLGCGKGMVKAIDWFFRNVREGIILEDDIEFDSSFLNCMQLLLNTYRTNRNIGSVTGFNPLGVDEIQRILGTETNYYLHPFFSSWGWATWSDRWENFQYDLTDWRKIYSPSKLFRFGGVAGIRYWSQRFDSVETGSRDTWDFQYIFMQFKMSQLCIAASRNLISNAGFRPDATHTKVARIEYSREKWEFSQLVQHIEGIKESRRATHKYLYEHYHLPKYRKRLLQKLKMPFEKRL